MTFDLLTMFLASLIPFVFSFIWYNPKLFGGENWVKIAGLTEKQAANPPKPLLMLSTIIFNFMIATVLYQLCVHQSGIYSLVGNNIDSVASGTAAAFLAEYATNFLTFKHGALHGVLTAIFFVVPILMYIVIFEQKSAKYFWVAFGFWAISLGLMGGVICRWGTQMV